MNSSYPSDGGKHHPPNLPRAIDPFSYTPLLSKSSFRIMQLHPGNGSLSCTLHSNDIANMAMAYEAVSYVWGSDAAEEHSAIYIDDAELAIGSNISCALRYIRHATEPRLLWVDAVCINQRDDDERSQQVKLMGEIFGNAKTVLIWMGEDHNGEAEDCFALIKNTNEVLDNLLLQHDDLERIPQITLASKAICSDHIQWDAVRRLMDLEWFTRVWVLQEVGLARSAIILYGNFLLNWSELVELMGFVAGRADVATHTGNIKSGTLWDIFDDIWRTFDNIHTWRNELPLTRLLNQTLSGGQSFVDILNVTRGYSATDQRDHVYAFLGHPRALIADTKTHASQESRPIVDVDYHKSVDQIFLETAACILQSDPHPWTVLSCVDHSSNSASLEGEQSSWVPRWDEGWRTYWLGYATMWYRAGGEHKAAFCAELIPKSPIAAHLKVVGIELDTIDWHSQPFDSENLKPKGQKETGLLQTLWEELQSRGPLTALYGNTMDLFELAYSLVLAAGRAADDGPAENDISLHKAVYKAYLDLICRQRSSSKDNNLEDSGTERYAIQQEPSTIAAQSESVGGLEEEQSKAGALEIETLTYIANQRRALHNRRVFRTSKGYLGVGHKQLRLGDVCVVLKGANVPFVLRRQLDSDGAAEVRARESNYQDNRGSWQKPRQYKLVGECYIQGIMRGEVFDTPDLKGYQQSWDGSEAGSSLVEGEILIT